MTTINTSRNTTPKVLKSKPFMTHMNNLITSMDYLNVLNYGAGKYWENVSDHVIYQYHILKPVIVAYEPYLNDNDIGSNYKTDQRTYLTNNLNNTILARYNTVICSNVLNVIEDDQELLDVIRDCITSLSQGGKAFFSIYEGDRLGEGKTTRDGYQRHQKAMYYSSYFRMLFNELGFTYKRNGTIITITKL